MGLWSIFVLIVAGPILAEPVPCTAALLCQDLAQIVSEKSVTAALAELTPQLMSLSGVVGVGEGRCDGKPCIRVLVAERSSKLVEQINEIVQGETVEIVETGEIRAR